MRIDCKAAPCATPVPTHRQCKTFWAAGSWLLGILAEQDRYAHIGSLRGNGVAPEVLGMGKIIGDDSLRRALAAIAPAPNARYSVEERAAQQAQALKAEQWRQAQLRHSIAQATKIGWILDCDTTVKVLYGHQDWLLPPSIGTMQSSQPSNSVGPEIASFGQNLDGKDLRVVLLEGIDPSALGVFLQAGLTQVVSISHAPTGAELLDLLRNTHLLGYSISACPT